MKTETTEQGAAAAPPPPEPMLPLRNIRIVLELLDQAKGHVDDGEYEFAAEVLASAPVLARSGPKALYRALGTLVEALEWGEEDDEEACCARCGATCVACGMDGDDPHPSLERATKLATAELERVERSLYQPRGAVAEA